MVQRRRLVEEEDEIIKFNKRLKPLGLWKSLWLYIVTMFGWNWYAEGFVNRHTKR